MLREAEVSNFDVVFLCEENVLRLDISVQQIFAVKVLDPLANLNEISQNESLTEIGLLIILFILFDFFIWLRERLSIIFSERIALLLVFIIKIVYFFVL